jgi:hypothetical protein
LVVVEFVATRFVVVAFAMNALVVVEVPATREEMYAWVVVEFVVVEFVAVSAPTDISFATIVEIVARVAVKVSMTPVMKCPTLAKRFVDVALVVVEFAT